MPSEQEVAHLEEDAARNAADGLTHQATHDFGLAGTQRAGRGDDAEHNAKRLDDKGDHDAATDEYCQAARDYQKAVEDYDQASEQQTKLAEAILQQGWAGYGNAVRLAADYKGRANEAAKHAARLCQICGERSVERGDRRRAREALMCAQKLYIRLGEVSSASAIGRIIELLQRHGMFQDG